MNSRDRSTWYPKILQKQHGEYCVGCGISTFFNPRYKLKGKYSIESKPGIERSFLCDVLYIDHIDNDNSHNELKNLQLLCPSCNRIKNIKKSENIPERAYTPEMALNRAVESKWRNWVADQVQKTKEITIDEAINGGAERFAISPETAKKYVRKILSEQGDEVICQNSIVNKNDIPELEEESAQQIRENDVTHDKVNAYSKQEFDKELD